MSAYPVLKAIAPEINYSVKKIQLIVEGARENTFYAISPTDPTSTSSSTIQITPPNGLTSVSRQMFLHYTGSAVFTGTYGAPGTRLLQEGCIAMRAFPLSRCTTNQSLQINSIQSTIQPQSYLPELMKMANPSYNQAGWLSCVPNVPDFYTVFSDFNGYVRSPFADYGDVNQGECNPLPRTVQMTTFDAAGNPHNPVNAGATGSAATATIYFEVYEPVLTPPCIITKENGPGLRAVSNIIFQNLYGDLSQMFSVDNASSASTVTGIAVSLNSMAMELNYLTPLPDSILGNAPQTDYNWVQITPYQSTGSSMLAGTSQQLVSQNIQIPCVPDYFMLFVRPADSLRSAYTADWNLAITNLSVNFDNKIVLNSASPHQLYDMCVRNNLCGVDYAQFRGQSVDTLGNGSVAPSRRPLGGSPLILSPSLDFGLSGGLANGVVLPTGGQCQFTVTVVNQSAATVSQVVFYVLTIQNGILTISNGDASTRIGVVSVGDVIAARQEDSPFESFNAINDTARKQTFTGGGLGDIFNKARHLLSQGLNVASKVAPGVSQLASLVSPTAAKYIQDAGKYAGIGGDAIGGRRRRGGAVLSRSALRGNYQ